MWSWLVRWFQRFVGLEKITAVQILPSVLDDLAAMARSAHPKEMLAFLSATKGIRDGVLVIDEIQLQAYYASVDSASVPWHQLPTFSSIVGTVHSHPSSSRRPSTADLRLFAQHGLVHGIMGYPYTSRSVTFYDGRGREIPVSVDSFTTE